MAELKGIYKIDFKKVKKYIEKNAAKCSEREEALESLLGIYIDAQENDEGIFAIHRGSPEEYAKEICEGLPAKKQINKKWIFAVAAVIAIVLGAVLLINPQEEVPPEEKAEYKIDGEKVAYFYDGKLSLDVMFENTGNKPLYVSFDTEISYYTNSEWSVWFNNENYSGGAQLVAPGEKSNFFGKIDFSGRETGMAFEQKLFRIRREIFTDSELKESIGFAEWIFDIETYSGTVAYGSFGTKFAPDQISMPDEVVFANEEQKNYCEELIENINYLELTRFYAESFPNDNKLTAEISRENAAKIIDWLKETELVTCEPKNPNTGGGYSFYIETLDENIAVHSNGGFFTISRAGDDVSYAFDAESCSDTFGKMWGIAEEILAEYVVDEEEETNPAIGHDIYAFVSNEFEGGGKYFPDSSVLPNGIEWGNKEQADSFKEIIDNLQAGNIKSFMAAFTPASSGKTVTIGGNQADVLLKLLRTVKLVPGKPQNPTTTGGFAFHIVTNDNDYIVISSDLNALRISMKGQDANYYFNAADYSDEIWNIMLVMDEMINSEKDIGKVGSTTGESHLIPNEIEPFVTLFSNTSKTASTSYAVNEFRDLLIYQNLTINPDENLSALGKALSEVDVIEFVKKDDGSKYTLELYEKGFILKGSAVPEGKRGQQWVVEDDTWEYFINKINTEFENADFKIPYWFGLVSPKRVTEVVVFGENGEKYKYIQNDDSFDNFFSIFRSDIRVSSVKERFEGNKMPNPVTEKYIRLRIYFATGTVYEIIAEQDYITMVSSDMNYGLRYNLAEKADAYDAFLDYAEGGPINAVTG